LRRCCWHRPSPSRLSPRRLIILATPTIIITTAITAITIITGKSGDHADGGALARRRWLAADAI